MHEEKLAKVKKALGKDTVEEIDAMDALALKKVIVEAAQAMATAKAEMELNSAYTAVKDSYQAFQAGLRDVQKRQNAKIALALHRLEHDLGAAS